MIVTGENIEQFFTSLKIPGWHLYQKVVKEGGQALVLKVVNKELRTEGAFRIVNFKKPIDKKRFERELTILTNSKFESSFIMRPLAHGISELVGWYITEWGTSLSEYWKGITERNNPDGIVTIAVDVVRQISVGLTPLHGEKVVHRDIKPANIVILGGRPVLIDFGLVYDPAEDRISDPSDPVGNLKFSPDQMMYHLDEVPPYLDVFMLVQVLIWMVREHPGKNWSRPLDWKWVIYPKEIDLNAVERIRALSAVCSDYFMSPKNCGELNALILSLFNDKSVNERRTEFEDIRSIVASGRARSMTEYSHDRTNFESAYPLFETLLSPVTAFLYRLKSKAEAERLPMSFAVNSIEIFTHAVRQTTRFKREIMDNVHSVICGDHPGEIFYVNFVVTFYPEEVHKGTQIADLIPIDLRIYRQSSDHGEFNRAFQVAINSSGQLYCLESARAAVSMEEIITMLENLIFDQEVWKAHKH